MMNKSRSVKNDMTVNEKVLEKIVNPEDYDEYVDPIAAICIFFLLSLTS